MMILIRWAAALAVGAGAHTVCKPQTVARHARLVFPGGHAISVDVADTPASREIGLMCRPALPPDYGMLFVFPQEEDLNFWMKNTWVDLDIVWIGANKKITVIHEGMPKSRRDASDNEVASAGGRGQYVLELPAGAAARRHLKAGDALKFKARKVRR